VKVHPVVFSVSATVIVLFVVMGAKFNQEMEKAFGVIQDTFTTYAGWLYIVAVAFFLVFAVWLLFGRFGHIRLGKDDERPEFSYLTWLAMLFSAGMGIGLVFFSVAEPMMHFANEDLPGGSAAGSVDRAKEAMRLTFFHWGLHAWAIYAVVALALAYFGFRHDLPLTIRSALYPLIGDRIHGPIGNTVDILAVFGTLFGLATSLGFGVTQINAGLEYLGLMEVSTGNQVLLIAGITLAATVSVVTGLGNGIRRLSELNMIAAGLLLLFVFVAGPTLFLLRSYVQGVGDYASNLIHMTFNTDAFIGLEWQKAWTMFYWAWWISWSPFVGMFIARVSRGRTIREFVTGVLFIPSVVTFLWLTIFGNTALHIDLFGSGGISQAVQESIPTALYVMLDELPISAVTATLATIVIAIFFVTSSDSGSLVIDIITSGGHPDPPIPQRVFWAVTEGAVAAVLLYSGGLQALQTAAITTALPFCLVLLVICYGLTKGLRAEVATEDPLSQLLRRFGSGVASLPRTLRGALPPAMTRGRAAPPRDAGRSESWNGRLQQIMSRGSEERVEEEHEEAYRPIARFIEGTVAPAFRKLETELREGGREVTVQSDATYASLQIQHLGEEEFSYVMEGHTYRPLRTAYPEPPAAEPKDFRHRASVVLRSGTLEEHDLEYWTEERIIDHFVHTYAQWMGW